MIYELGKDKVEMTGEDFFVAPTATVLGKVVLANNVSIWFGAVLRGAVSYTHLTLPTIYSV